MCRQHAHMRILLYYPKFCLSVFTLQTTVEYIPNRHCNSIAFICVFIMFTLAFDRQWGSCMMIQAQLPDS